MTIRQCDYESANMVLIGIDECGDEFYACSARVSLEYIDEEGKELETRMMWQALHTLEESVKPRYLTEENSTYSDCWYWEDRRQWFTF